MASDQEMSDEWVELTDVKLAQSRETDALLVASILLGLWALIAAIVAAIFLGVVRHYGPAPEANFARNVMRYKRKVLRFDEIDEAQLFGDGKNDFLYLRFGQRGGIHFDVTVRDESKVVRDSTQANLLAILEESTVAIPRDRFDPKGKFARSGFPSHLTRDEAISVVRDRPTVDDRLPVKIEPLGEF